jgi:hypothetical protein
MKQDKILTLKGMLVAGEVARINLFDGSFKSAYRILSFQIAPNDILTGEMCMMKMMTVEKAHGTRWFWDRNDEVGWAVWNTPIATRFGEYSRVDKEALIVEDLFLDCSADGGELVNYMIELEKVSISEWKAALAMVRNASQDV